MDYVGALLNDTIEISKLYTVYYFEYSKEYMFAGETHDFWEMVYVDKGEIIAIADGKEHLIGQGDIIFHQPNEWHELKATGTVAPNIVVVSFACNSEAMGFFKNKILKVNQNEKKIISRIIAEYSNAFSNPLNIQSNGTPSPRKECPVGSMQLLKNSIAELLISFLRSPEHISKQKMVVSSNNTVNLIINYMQNNLYNTICLGDIVKYSGSNKTTITKLFKQEFNMGVLEYFIYLKIEQAKLFLREDSYNITQISEILGYSGIHYFSRQFKKVTGMSPTQYASSVKSMFPSPQ